MAHHHDVATYDVAAVVTEATRLIHHSDTLEDTLEAVVEATRSLVPGFDHVGVCLVNGADRVETMAATHPVVHELDQLQYAYGEGPVLAVLDGEPVVVVEQAQHEQRWPRYTAEALRAGLRAQLAVVMRGPSATLGALNLYSLTSEGVPSQARQLASLLAGQAAVAVERARREHQLREALTTRALIGQATGLTMARYDVGLDRAFDYLKRESQTRNVKLRRVAQEIVDEWQREHRTPVPADPDPGVR